MYVSNLHAAQAAAVDHEVMQSLKLMPAFAPDEQHCHSASYWAVFEHCFHQNAAFNHGHL